MAQLRSIAFLKLKSGPEAIHLGGMVSFVSSQTNVQRKLEFPIKQRLSQHNCSDDLYLVESQYQQGVQWDGELISSPVEF